MTFKTFLWIIGLAGSFPLCAQENKKQPAHIGFVYPISSNGKQAAQYTNNFSMHALTGVSRNETGMAMAGISLVIKDSAAGLQMAGISNHIGKTASGVQLAGIINTMGTSKGLSAAGIANIAGDANVQLAGISNYARQAQGFQAAGIINKASKAGAQMAGISNIAADIEGVQIAGIFNKAKKVKGAQIAGILNIADSSDYAIGIINIIKNGTYTLSASIDESATSLLSFRSGGRIMYGIIGLGYNGKAERDLWAFEVGLGVHLLARKQFSLQAEITNTGLFNFKGGEYYKYAVRVLPAFRLSNRFSLWAGPSFAYIHTDIPETIDFVHTLWDKQNNHNNVTQQLAFGFIGGVQLKL